MPDTSARPAGEPPVDPRGVRFSTGLTTLALALVLLTGSAWLHAAQATGFAFAAVGTAGYLAGLPVLGLAATALALAAAFLNAAFGYCLGCEMYAPIARLKNENRQGATA